MLLLRESRREGQTDEEIERLSAEHARLSDQLITAEQEERRRLALFLHDGPVQSLAGIALMLDAVAASVEAGHGEDSATGASARRWTGSARRSARSATSRSSWSRSCCAIRASPRPCERSPSSSAIANQIEFDLDVAGADALAERAQVAIYQIIRDALHQAIRRGPPTRISIRVGEERTDGVEALIADDAPGERRRRSFEAIEERGRGR